MPDTESEEPGISGPDQIPDFIKALFGRKKERLSSAETSRPEEVTLATRLDFARMEEALVFSERALNSYLVYVTFFDMAAKADFLEIGLPLGMGELSRQEVEAGLENDEKRNKLVEALRTSAKEMLARLSLDEKIYEQLSTADDLDTYCIKAFVSAGKKRVHAEQYGTILTAKETYPGLEPFGQKVAKAFGAWKDLAEGRAQVKFDRSDGIKILTRKENQDGTVTDEELEINQIGGTFPNIFALPLNLELLRLAMKKWVEPQIGYKISEYPLSVEEKAKRLVETRDNRAAALLGYILFRHWDYPLVYALGTKGTGRALDPTDISPRDLTQTTLEIGRQGTDASKLMIAMRQALEFYGSMDNLAKDKPREHPRAAGAPASFRCYPTLTAPFLRLTTLDDIEICRQDNEGHLIKKRVSMSIEELCFGTGKVQVLERLDGTGKPLSEPRLVEYAYDKCELPQIPWDKATTIGFAVNEEKIVDPATREPRTVKKVALNEQGEKALSFALGVNADAFEVPFKLEQFYAAAYMFNNFMRTDFPGLYEDVTGGGKNPDFPVKMGKAVDVALGLMAEAYGLDEELTRKLNSYVRVAFLGSLAVALTFVSGSRGGAEKVSRRKRPQTANPQRQEGIRTGLLNAAVITGFLTTELTKEGMVVVKQEQELLDRIIREGEAPPPERSGWFTKAELIKLAPLYPLSPFPR